MNLLKKGVSLLILDLTNNLTLKCTHNLINKSQVLVCKLLLIKNVLVGVIIDLLAKNFRIAYIF
jgi:hypothetical protein